MIVNKISFTGKPDSFPSPKTKCAPCYTQMSELSFDGIDIVQYKILASARMKLRDAQTDVVFLSEEKDPALKNELKRSIRRDIDNAISSIDKILEHSKIKFYYKTN